MTENKDLLQIEELSEDYNILMQERIKKIKQIEESGVNPYVYKYEPTHYSTDILDHFEEYSEEDVFKLAGRIMSFRNMGKASFMDIQDTKGRIQVYLNSKELGQESYDFLKLLDIGDHVSVEGTKMKTKTGQITIRAKAFSLLAKGIRPLPEKYHGISNKDFKYRYRSIDMIMNPDVKEVFIKRAKALAAIREFLAEQNFVEMETPILCPNYGGAEAKPFITHYNALNYTAYLSISPELYLKRLVVGGIDRVYYLGKAFRNEGIDRTHSPEFTLFECYMAYADYHDMMVLTENLYEYVFNKVRGNTVINYDDHVIDFKAPWRRARMVDLIKEFIGIDVESLSLEEILQEMTAKNIQVDEDVDLNSMSKGNLIVYLFEQECEHHLIQPTFVIDYPKESSPLCKVHRQNPDYIERFEPFANGVELGNAYSELNNPITQRYLLENQNDNRKKEEVKDIAAVDEQFLVAMEVGMPPTGGLGLGIDRLIMFLTESYTIKDVIPFIFMKSN